VLVLPKHRCSRRASGREALNHASIHAFKTNRHFSRDRSPCAGRSLGGYLISRRALRPVDQITTAAESISITNLSDRLEVPRSSDELQRLSETLNRMLARLDASVQRMSQLTADASHELRAPVSLIRTTAELAVQGDRTNAEYHEDMVQILAEAERTSRLI
jgi:signal transduction histidine kinase